MIVGEAPDHRAKAFLRPRGAKIESSKSGFDVSDANPVEEGAQCRRVSGRGVALDDHQVRLNRAEYVRQGRENGCGERFQALPGLHHRKVEVGRDPEKVADRPGHVPVLAGRAHLHGERPMLAKGKNYRRKLDRFGTSAEDDKNSLLAETHTNPFRKTRASSGG